MSRSKLTPYDPKYPTTRNKAPDTEALHKRLEADLEAFRAGGGEIEVLRITRPRDRRDDDADIPGPAAATSDRPRG